MKRFVLIGHPVGHSLSPAMHRAAYAALGQQAIYEAVDCADETAVAAQVAELRAGRIDGANVTVPWKRVALALADAVDPSAAETGAANVLCRESSSAGARVVAFNTDARALVRELGVLMGAAASSADHSTVVHSTAATSIEGLTRVALILGAGGAALAAAVACRQLSVTHVAVTTRRWTETKPQAEWPEVDAFLRLGAQPIAWEGVEAHCVSDRWQQADARLVVQATSAGMQGVQGGEQLAAKIPWQRLQGRIFAYDVVYAPPLTPFLRSASAAAVVHAGGLGMLAAQAEAAVQLWLDTVPPPHVMLQAALETLKGRG